ncbi:hypothetical protein ACG7TL_009017 [Trametes sanguinea]
MIEPSSGEVLRKPEIVFAVPGTDYESEAEGKEEQTESESDGPDRNDSEHASEGGGSGQGESESNQAKTLKEPKIFKWSCPLLQ